METLLDFEENLFSAFPTYQEISSSLFILPFFNKQSWLGEKPKTYFINNFCLDRIKSYEIEECINHGRCIPQE